MNNEKIFRIFDDTFKKLDIIKDFNNQTYTKMYKTTQNNLQDISNKFNELSVPSKDALNRATTTSVSKNTKKQSFIGGNPYDPLMKIPELQNKNKT